MTIVSFGVTVGRVVVHHAIPSVEHQLQECMRVRVVRAGAHLHWQEKNGDETEDADEREHPPGVPFSGPERG